MMSIAFKEGLEISPMTLSEIISGTGCDVRQSLNHLAMLIGSGRNPTPEDARKEAQKAKKDVVKGPWEVCRAVFTANEQKSMSLGDKANLFFYDYSLGPLYVQDNYLRVQPTNCDR